MAAQVIKPGEIEIKAFHNYITNIKNKYQPTKFIRLYMKSLPVILLSDSSFANNKDLTRQIGYVFILVDEQKSTNIVQ